jgi:hypothetical protein
VFRYGVTGTRVLGGTAHQLPYFEVVASSQDEAEGKAHEIVGGPRMGGPVVNICVVELERC